LALLVRFAWATGVQSTQSRTSFTDITDKGDNISRSGAAVPVMNRPIDMARDYAARQLSAG
jgi:hypothetical protein